MPLRDGAGQQVLLDRQRLEAAATLQDLDHALGHEIGRGAPADRLAVDDDRAGGDLAALGAEQVGHRLQEGGLAGAVGAEQGHDLAPAHGQADTAQGDDALIVGRLDVARDEQGLGRGHPLASFLKIGCGGAAEARPRCRLSSARPADSSSRAA